MSEENRDKTPVYLDIRRYLLELISSEELTAHSRLPSEEALCRRFGVARGTVRQALGELAVEGIIYRLHGKGSFVSPARYEHRVGSDRFLSFLEELQESGVSFENQVLDQQCVPPEREVRARLQLPAGEPALRLVRLRKKDGVPLMLSVNHIPVSLAPGLEEEDFTAAPLYPLLEREYKLRPDWGLRRFRAVLAPERASLLGLPADSPLSFIEQIVYDRQGRCIDCAHLFLPGDSALLTLTVRPADRRRRG